MVVPEANNPRTSTDLTHQRNRGHARALANNPKATDTTEHRATRVLQRNRPLPVVRIGSGMLREADIALLNRLVRAE